VAIRQGETINVPALTAMFKHNIANNRAGGWPLSILAPPNDYLQWCAERLSHKERNQS
jgi:hypothetical protein